MTITSSTGLVSGMDIENIVTQLMAIEARGRDQLQDRSDRLSDQQEALKQLQTVLKTLQLSAANFGKKSVFQAKSGASNNADVLGVTASRFASVGSYNFTVKQLASQHQLVSSGYSSADSSIGSGTISIEMGHGQLNKATDLSTINGGQGLTRGKIKLTDGDGNEAVIDLSAVLSMQDVLDEINTTTTINIEASVSGDHLVLTDTSVGTDGISVEEVNKGTTAASLGLVGIGVQLTSGGKELQGTDLVAINEQTQLKLLNDGNGIRGLDSGLNDIKFTLRDGSELGIDLSSKMYQTIGDDSQSTRLSALNSGAGVRTGTFRITDRNGRTVNIDLEDLGPNATMAQLKTHIEAKAKDDGMAITVSFNNQDHIVLTDKSTSTTGTTRASNFIIEDLYGGKAASDLGIVDDVNGSTLTGDTVWKMETLGDVISAVNNHWNNDGLLEVSINSDGTGLQLSDTSALSGTLKVEAVNDSFALADLGLADYADNGNGVVSGHRLVSGLNTVFLRSLNGGNGGNEDRENRITNGGSMTLQDRQGNSTGELTFDVNATVQDVIDAINSSTTNLHASLNSTGNGILIEDTTETAQASSNMTITGDLAEKLNLTANTADHSIDSGNLQLQYISDATLLSEMRQGEGISMGSFQITGSNGVATTISINDGTARTIGDVIDLINQRSTLTNVQARINDNGDGIILEDTNENPTGTIQVAEVSGSTARDLNIFGISDLDSGYIDGSYEYKVDVGGGDSLEEIASQINDANIGVTASIVNDGSGGNAYRLHLTSDVSGTVGRIYLDGGTTSLSMNTLAKGEDAIMFMGEDSQNSLLVSSHSNTVDQIVKGVTLDLKSASDDNVTVTVGEDLETIVASIENFVEAYNSTMDLLSELDYYDVDTQERSLLYGDSTVRNIENILERLPLYYVDGGLFNRMSEVGLKASSISTETATDATGKSKTYAVASTQHLTFDETTFRAMFDADPDAVTDLFTKEETGVGNHIDDMLEDLAGTRDSTMTRYLDSLDSRQRMFSDRLEYMDDLLASKEARLYNQFYAMETALASLQSQQTSLSSLSALTSSSQG